MSELIKISEDICKKCKYCQQFYTHRDICCMYAAIAAEDLRIKEKTRVLNVDGSFKYNPSYCDKFTEWDGVSKRWVDELFTPKAITKEQHRRYFGET